MLKICNLAVWSHILSLDQVYRSMIILYWYNLYKNLPKGCSTTPGYQFKQNHKQVPKSFIIAVDPCCRTMWLLATVRDHKP